MKLTTKQFFHRYLSSIFPPLLIQYNEGKFYCLEQKELLAALKQRKVNAYPTVIALKEAAEYKRFMKYYGNVLFFIDDA